MNKSIAIVIVILFSCLQSLFSQNLKRANMLFEERSYLDAAELFLKEKNKTQDVYEKLGDCYYFNAQMLQASNWYRDLVVNFKDKVKVEYLYRYSQSLYGKGDYKEAKKWLDLYQSKNSIPVYSPTAYTDLSSKKSIYDVQSLKDINTEMSDFGGGFLKNKFIFSSSRKEGKSYNWNNQTYLDLFIAEVSKDGQLVNCVPFSNKINTDLHESNAIFTKDGKTMYYTGSNQVNGKKIFNKDNINVLKIYKAELVNNEWTNVVELPINGNDFSTEHPALSDDETQLYFSSDRSGSIGSFDIFVVDILETGNFGTPKNLGTKINTEHREQFPFVLKDTLYFSSDGHFGLGGLDVFKSTIKKDSITKPVNLYKNVNSNLDDFSFVINDSLNIGYVSSNRAKGLGSDDLYMFKIKPKAKPQVKEVTINRTIKDKNTLEPINDVLVVLYKDDRIIDKQISDPNGIVKFNIKDDFDKNYKIRTSHEFYLPQEEILDVNDENKDKDLLLDKYIEFDKQIVVKNAKTQIDHEPILFDMDSSYLTQKAMVILDDVVRVLEKYPDINIRCESHTDSRETHLYNDWLSDRRAMRTADYLVSKGIDRTRITQKGFGETQILNGCTDGVYCTEDQHLINRRTEFVLIKRQD